MAKSKTKIYDFVVVHCGFGGALIAHKLSEKGHNVALIKTISAIGQEDVLVSTHKGRLKKNMAAVADSEKNRQLLQWFAQTLGKDSLFTPYKQAVKTVDSGSLVNFLGFGDQKFKSVDLLSDCNTSDFLHINENFEDFHQSLLESGSFDLIEDAEITSVDISEENVHCLGINGSKDILSRYFILADSLKPFFELVPDNEVPPRLKTKVAKSKTWSQVSLHLESSQPLTEDLSLHMLMGSKTDFEPCVGRFFQPEEDGKQQSVWMTLVESEMLEDTEFLASSLKNLKRQIKRAYETLLDQDSLSNEKIVVLKDSYGQIDLGIKEGLFAKGLNNLILANSLQFQSRGALADLEVASQALSFIENSELCKETKDCAEISG